MSQNTLNSRCSDTFEKPRQDPPAIPQISSTTCLDNNFPTISKKKNFIDEFENVRISALTKGAEISPYVNEVTIGPQSKELSVINSKVEIPVQIPSTKNLYPKMMIIKEANENQNYQIIKREIDNRWHDNAKTVFQKYLSSMISRRSTIMADFWRRQGEEFKRKINEQKPSQSEILVELQSTEEPNELFETVNQNPYEINSKTIEQMKLILQQQNQMAKQFALLTEKHATVHAAFEDILNNSETSNIVPKYKPLLTAIVHSINNIIETSKSTIVTDRELCKAEELETQMLKLKRVIWSDIDRLREEENQKHIKQLEDERLKKLEQEKQLEKEKAAKIEDKNYNSEICSAKSFELFVNSKQYLELYEAKYRDLLNDVSLKKFRFDCQKAVNTPVNSISFHSGPNLMDKYDKLSKLLKGERVLISDSYVSINQHPSGFAYCANLLAKKIVRQGDLLVSSKPEAAFPLASITVALWSHFPELGELLQAHFFLQCPYIIPMYIPQTAGQTDQEYYKARGYIYNEDGTVEKQEQYLKRMSGIFSLCCAIWITKASRVMTGPSPHGLMHAWRWLSAFINLKPEPDVSATLLYDFLTICGSEFYQVYRKQFHKILAVIRDVYFKILANIDEGGPKTRLEVLLQNISTSGIIEPPKGMLQPSRELQPWM